MTTSRTSLLQRSKLPLWLMPAGVLFLCMSTASAALLAPSATPTSVTLTWTAPGDDSTTGTATSYDVRYSLSAITDANWGAATQVSGEPAPLAAGTVQTFDVKTCITCHQIHKRQEKDYLSRCIKSSFPNPY